MSGSDVFYEVHPNVWAIDEWHSGEVDELTNSVAASACQRTRLGAGETTGVAVLDGGIVFHSFEGERPDDDDDDDHLADGVYLIGGQCLRFICDALNLTPPEGSSADGPGIETLRQRVRDRRVVTGDADAQAAALADRAVLRDWGGLQDVLAAS